MKRIVFILAQNNFRDEELLEPLKVCQEDGIGVTIASEHKGKALGKLGAEIEAEMAIADVSADDFDGIIFVGGKASRIYAEDPNVWKLLQNFEKKKKVIGAIGTAPTILANAAILLNKKATSDHEEKETLVMRGVNYTSLQVQVDGNIVTARGPEDAREFGKQIIKLLR